MKRKLTITGTPSADGQSLTLSASGKGVSSVILVGKAKRGKKTTVTDPSGVSVSYKVGKKPKTVKLALMKSAC